MNRAIQVWAIIGTLLFSLPSYSEDLQFKFSFPEPELRPADGYFKVVMGKLPVAQNTGEPLLPYRPVRILIPRGMEVEKLEIQEGTKMTIPGKYRVKPAQEQYPLSQPGPYSPTQPDPAIYNSNEPYPRSRSTYVSLQKKGPYNILLLNLHPVSYLPATGEVSYFEEIDVRLALGPRVAKSMKERKRRGSLLQEKAVKKMVENPGALSSYDLADRRETLGKEGPLDSYPHVIITSQALENASGAYTFQDLRDHRTARGMSSTIVTTEYIYANFDGTRPDGGSDNQTRIRNFISWARDNWGTEYVLLGGYSGIIPIRGLYASGTNIPADMYYGNLDGTFDNNANGTYGETNDGVGGGDIDLYTEAYIGRACVGNDTDVANLVRKIIAYETSSDDYLREAYMVGELLWSSSNTWAKDYLEEIRLGSCAHGYCTEGFASNDFFQTSTLYDYDYQPGQDWPNSEIISIINSDAAILNHLGHANYTYDMKLYTSDLSSLTNTKYFFLYSQGCMPGGFDTTDCFAEVVTTMEHGAFAAVLNARYGYGSHGDTDGASQYYNREFWDALFNENIQALGAMNADSKEDNDFRINDSYMRWCHYELNLFGDPATEIQDISSMGRVSFSADAYPIPGTATVTVMDLDLDADPGSPDMVTVAVSGDTETTPESLLLTETGSSTRTFRGSIPVAAGSPAHGDGTLQVTDGDTLTVVYHDEDDGTGSPADVQDTASADGSGPVISNVQHTPSATSCTITWNTDEPGDSLVRYGEETPPSTETSDSTLTISHSLRIRFLDPLTTYYFEVVSTDGVGNTTIDNNGGSWYEFTTLERGAILFVDDDEGDSYESYFTSALDANSYGYDVWEVSLEGSSPTFSDMDDYYVVIWNCGYDYGNSTSGLTTSEESALSEYMDGGGSVFLCGQDIIYNGVSSGFRTDYLHLAGYNSDDQTTQANGIDGDRISGGMSLSLSYPYYNWSDSLSPDSSSSGVFLTDGSTYLPYSATRYPADGVSGPFRIVFFAFPFEAISSVAAEPNNAATVMDRVLRFLSPLEVEEIEPAYGLNDRPTAVTIYGSYFAAGLTASIGGVYLTDLSITATEISGAIPAGLDPGIHDLVVKNPDSLRATIEAAYTALDPAADNDQDGLSNEAEVATHGTDPFTVDTDGDGLDDGDEINTHSTDPNDTDSDDDCLDDYEEVNTYATNPNSADSDGDTWCDVIEIASGTNPNDPISTPGVLRISFQPGSSERPDDYAPSSNSGYSTNLGYGWR